MNEDNNKKTFKDIKLLLPLFSVIVITAALQLLPAHWQQQLRYTPEGFGLTEPWRIISGHFIHLGWEHWLLNIAGLVMITLLFPREVKPLARLAAFYLFSSIFVSACFRIFSPELVWYVGLSGVLHAMMVFCILENLPEFKTTNLLLLAGIIAKVLHEIFVGPEASTAAFIKGNIVYQAHAYGVIAGFLFYGLSFTQKKLYASKAESLEQQTS